VNLKPHHSGRLLEFKPRSERVKLSFGDDLCLLPQVKTLWNAVSWAQRLTTDLPLRPNSKRFSFSTKRPDQLWGPPILLFIPGLFFGCYSRGVMLTTLLQLSPITNKWNYNPTPPYTFSCWTETTLSLTLSGITTYVF